MITNIGSRSTESQTPTIVATTSAMADVLDRFEETLVNLSKVSLCSHFGFCGLCHYFLS